MGLLIQIICLIISNILQPSLSHYVWEFHEAYNPPIFTLFDNKRMEGNVVLFV